MNLFRDYLFATFSDCENAFQMAIRCVGRSQTHHVHFGRNLYLQRLYAKKEIKGHEYGISQLSRLSYDSFTLQRIVAQDKFGPNYIKVKAPLNNIRITPFFCDEGEVHILDPNRVKIVEAIGCDVRHGKLELIQPAPKILIITDKNPRLLLQMPQLKEINFPF